MRSRFNQTMHQIHQELIHMASLCEQSIQLACQILFVENDEILMEVEILEKRINEQERRIEDLCKRVLLLEQPIANDLKQISTALKMITDLERIGDQALDIATLEVFPEFSMNHCFEEMCKVCQEMLRQSITAFIQNDLHLAKEIVKMDDVVDRLFVQVKNEAAIWIATNPNDGYDVLNLLMAAKYLERMADHSVNIAEEVLR